MSTTINGITAYETKVRGNVRYFIRQDSVLQSEIALFDQAEINATSIAGYQEVNTSGNAVGTGATGLANDATVYTATINIDGTDVAVAVTGSAAQTYTNLITEINTDLGTAGTAALSGGNIVITSGTTGNASYVMITDVNLFSSLTDFGGIKDAREGGMIEALRTTTLSNGKDAWSVYKSAEQVFDPADPRVILSSDYVPANISAVFSDVEVEAELSKLADKVNALRKEV